MRNLALAALAMIAVTAPSRAAVFNISVTGIVSEGYDDFGYFGGEGGDLSGTPFLISMRLDDAAPGAFSSTGENFQRIFSINWNPVLTGNIKIGGKLLGPDTATVNNADVLAIHQNEFGYDGFSFLFDYSYVTADYFESVYIDLAFWSYENNYFDKPDFRGPFSHNFDEKDFSGSYFSYLKETYGRSPNVVQGQVGGLLIPKRIVISSPVPEPLTWWTLIAGFTLIGFGMRRRATALEFSPI